MIGEGRLGDDAFSALERGQNARMQDGLLPGRGRCGEPLPRSPGLLITEGVPPW